MGFLLEAAKNTVKEAAKHAKNTAQRFGGTRSHEGLAKAPRNARDLHKVGENIKGGFKNLQDRIQDKFNINISRGKIDVTKPADGSGGSGMNLNIKIPMRELHYYLQMVDSGLQRGAKEAQRQISPLHVVESLAP